MQLGNNTRTRISWNRRQRSADRARLGFNPSLPREGRIAKACRRCFIAHNGLASMRQLRSWAYPARARHHWFYRQIYDALRRLNARRVGWGIYASDNHTEGLSS
jgi:hypothetical protein